MEAPRPARRRLHRQSCRPRPVVRRNRPPGRRRQGAPSPTPSGSHCCRRSPARGARRAHAARRGQLARALATGRRRRSRAKAPGARAGGRGLREAGRQELRLHRPKHRLLSGRGAPAPAEIRLLLSPRHVLGRHPAARQRMATRCTSRRASGKDRATSKRIERPATKSSRRFVGRLLARRHTARTATAGAPHRHWLVRAIDQHSPPATALRGR
jgi:hypothetical protein